MELSLIKYFNLSTIFQRAISHVLPFKNEYVLKELVFAIHNYLKTFYIQLILFVPTENVMQASHFNLNIKFLKEILIIQQSVLDQWLQITTTVTIIWLPYHWSTKSPGEEENKQSHNMYIIKIISRVDLQSKVWDQHSCPSTLQANWISSGFFFIKMYFRNYYLSWMLIIRAEPFVLYLKCIIIFSNYLVMLTYEYCVSLEDVLIL